MAIAMKYFKIEEFACPCCGRNITKDDAMQRIDSIREKLGFPLHINSGTRCAKHNKDVGGEVDSRHLFMGDAIDVSHANLSSKQKRDLLSYGMEQFNGIGLGKTFYHFDLGEAKLWVY